MNTKEMAYAFSAKVWFSEWFFVSLPVEMASEIRESFQYLEEGWGRLKVAAKIGDSEWETAIWFDTKHGTYILPIKKAIRLKEKVTVDSTVTVTLWI